jgi:hypothetical protein
LVEAIRKYRKLAEETPLTLQGSDFAQAVEELNRELYSPNMGPPWNEHFERVLNILSASQEDQI